MKARARMIGAAPQAGASRRTAVRGAAAIAAAILLRPEQRLAALLRKESILDQGIARAAPAAGLSMPLISLLGAREWLNTEPLQAADLAGKVVLVNFWTYSCINSLRALPYLKAWADKYGDRGLLVVGVHTPEFGFEKELANVKEATASLDVRYSVPLDSDYAVWRGFGNIAWPAFYFVGADGRVRHHVFGEGDYDQSERLIQKLLTEADATSVSGPLASVMGQGVEAEADWKDLRTEETYIGYAKAAHFVSPDGVREGAPGTYRASPMLPLAAWSLAGLWNVGAEFATLDDKSGRIAFRFHARDLHLVMGPSSPAQPIRFRVTLDGAPPGDNHGVDVDAEGQGRVQPPRMYQLIRQQMPIRDRTFEIEFLDPGVRAYVFTFG